MQTLSAITACLFLLISTTSVYSQRSECKTTVPEGYEYPREKYPVAYEKHLKEFKEQFNQRSSGGSCINYAPIKAHIVRRSDGTGGLSMTDLNDAMDNMNNLYADACMAFYLCDGVNYIDSDAFYDFSENEENDLTLNNVDGLINIYFCNSVSNTAGTSFYCGYAYFPGGADVILMDNSCTTNGSTFPHELGHFFSLPHTHSGGTELVNGSNCSTAGDRFCDTEADPTLGSSNVNSSCVYTGTATDTNGDTYAPNPRNVMSYSRKQCRDFFSVEQLAAISFTFLYDEDRNDWDCAGFDVDFSSDETQSCSSPFTVTFTEATAGATTYEWDFDNDGTVDATTANPSHTYNTDGIFDVCLTISDGTNSISKVKTAYISTASNLAPFESDMENFTVAYNATGFENGWTASPASTTSDFRWNVDNNGTVSTNTGPDVDHTNGNSAGIYVYTEASDGNSGDIAELISPCLSIEAGATNAMVSFWYHMYGSAMGTLHIDLHDGNSWIDDFSPAISGQQQSSGAAAYLQREFNVDAYAGQSIQIRFRGERAGSFRGDIAIDDFMITADAALPVDLVTFDGKATEQGQHLLSWQTLSEINSAYFEVEHAVDGRSFSPLGLIDAAGYSQASKEYDFMHKTPSIGANYYRLRMVDLDESFEYSEVIVLSNAAASRPNLSIYPNPGKGQYHLDMSDETEDLFFTVYNTVGQIIYSGQWSPQEGTYALDLNAMANGIYTIQVKKRDKVIAVEKLVKY